MSKRKSPASEPTQARHDETPQTAKGCSFSFVNFNDTTAQHILQVLTDLYCEQKGLSRVEVSLKKAE